MEDKFATDTEVIAKNINTFFTEIEPSLTKKTEIPAKVFDTYMQKCKTIQPENQLTISKIKDAFSSLQTSNIPGHDGIVFNVIKSCFGVFDP